MSELTYEKIANAIKATDYKYFGDYELSVKQLEAIETLVDASVELMPFGEMNTRTLQSEWISVDDKLPEDVQFVLFRLKGAAKTEKGIHLAGCKTFEADYSLDFYDYDDVSHWMPLPNPPETKK